MRPMTYLFERYCQTSSIENPEIKKALPDFVGKSEKNNGVAELAMRKCAKLIILE